MNNAYKIVNESLVVAVAAPAGLWWLNKKIRTLKVINDYKTPSELKAKLMESPDQRVRFIAAELNDKMTPREYRRWVAVKVNPKMGVGKAIFMSLGYLVTTPWQLGKAAVHSVENANDIVDRSIRKGRIFH